MGGVGVDALLVHDLGELQVALGHGVAERVHLVAVVVDVVLALHVIARVLEDAGERVSQGRPASVADVQRAHGVGRDELHLDALAGAEVGAAEVGALDASRAKDLVAGGHGQIDVDEAGSGDVHVVDLGRVGQVLGDGLGDGAGRHVGGLGAAQGNGARPVSVRGIGRALETEVSDLELRQLTGRLRLLDRCADQLLDRLDHDVSLLRARCNWLILADAQGRANQRGRVPLAPCQVRDQRNPSPLAPPLAPAARPAGPRAPRARGAGAGARAPPRCPRDRPAGSGSGERRDQGA